MFQQGVNGYTGTLDTMLLELSPTVANGSATTLAIDNNDAGTLK